MLSAVATLGFVMLAVAVTQGWLTFLDQWSVDHLMPGLSHRAGKPSSWLDSLIPFRHTGDDRQGVIRAICNTWTLPASIVPSVLLLGGLVRTLWQRGEREISLTLAIVFVAANAVEAICKSLLRRPHLDTTKGHGLVHLIGFDSSFPSGHTIRAFILVLAAAYLWPSWRRYLLIWLGAALLGLVLASNHVPSDVAGGLALTTALIALALAAVVMSRQRRYR